MNNRGIKAGARILAIDDSYFSGRKGYCLAVGIIGRSSTVEGVLSFKVAIDGDDATKAIMKAVKKSRFRDQVKIIVINGIVLAGLNIVDAYALYKKLGMPVVAITRKKPHPERLAAVIRRCRGGEKKLHVLESSTSHMLTARQDGYYLQLIGIGKKGVSPRFGEMLGLLRLARIIGSGLSRGESRGRM